MLLSNKLYDILTNFSNTIKPARKRGAMFSAKALCIAGLSYRQACNT